MISFEQRLLMVLEGIQKELRGIHEELQNFHGEKSDDSDDSN